VDTTTLTQHKSGPRNKNQFLKFHSRFRINTKRSLNPPNPNPKSQTVLFLVRFRGISELEKSDASDLSDTLSRSCVLRFALPNGGFRYSKRCVHAASTGTSQQVRFHQASLSRGSHRR